MKILVTAGATREPIDAVRFLSNISTGATGAALADELHRHGHKIVHLHGLGALLPESGIEKETFSSAEDLGTRLERRLADGTFNVVIMAAAVADYRPAHALPGKLASDTPEFSLRLVRTEKILPRLKSFSPRALNVVGFKLTADADAPACRAAVEAQFRAGGIDAVVHNDLAEIRRTAVHPFTLWRSRRTEPRAIAGVEALAKALLETFATFPP